MVVIFTSFSLAYVRSVMHYYFYSLSHYFPVVDTVFFFFFFLCFFWCFLFLFFFFFQAEDGIRDKLVTGVQTCALPISWIEDRNALALESGELRVDDRNGARHQRAAAPSVNARAARLGFVVGTDVDETDRKSVV